MQQPHDPDYRPAPENRAIGGTLLTTGLLLSVLVVASFPLLSAILGGTVLAGYLLIRRVSGGSDAEHGNSKQSTECREGRVCLPVSEMGRSGNAD